MRMFGAEATRRDQCDGMKASDDEHLCTGYDAGSWVDVWLDDHECTPFSSVNGRERALVGYTDAGCAGDKEAR